MGALVVNRGNMGGKIAVVKRNGSGLIMNYTVRVLGKPSVASEEIAFNDAISEAEKENYSGVRLDDQAYRFSDKVTYYFFHFLGQHTVWR